MIAGNPARKLILPESRKPCERVLSMDEVRRLLSAAMGREHLALRLLLLGGLRPAEPFRIDEAVKNAERQASGTRLGSAKTPDSNALVSISANLESRIADLG